MNFKAVLFDLDGTLLNTIDDLADSMNAVLSRFNHPVHDADKYKYFIGDGIYNLVARALPFVNADKEIVDSYLAAFREEYQMRIVEKTRPYPGIPELLDSLKHKGFEYMYTFKQTRCCHKICNVKTPWTVELRCSFRRTPGCP